MARCVIPADFGWAVNPAMLAALAGFTIVEALVLRVVAKFAPV